MACVDDVWKVHDHQEGRDTGVGQKEQIKNGKISITFKIRLVCIMVLCKFINQPGRNLSDSENFETQKTTAEQSEHTNDLRA